MTTMGERIRWVRGQRKMSRPKLAELSRVRYPTLAGIENGDQASSTRLHALASALSCRIEFLESGRGEWDATKTMDASATLSARLEEVRVVQALMARVLARSIPDAGLALRDAIEHLPEPQRSRNYLQDIRAVLDASLPPRARRVQKRQAQE